MLARSTQIGALVLLVAACPLAPAQAQQKQPGKQSLVTISKETTVITDPLDEQGYVDLMAAVNERFSEGVTPENNAAVMLRHALGLIEMKGNQEYRDQYDRMLGIEPAGEGIYVSLADVAREHGIEDLEKAYDLQLAAQKAPWSSEDYPTIAAWLTLNEPALEMIVGATERPRYYTPYVRGDSYPQLIAVLLPALQESREAARALLARAMLNAGEGRIEEAMVDLEAIHRLARLVAQDPTIVGGLVGIAIDSMAHHGDVALVGTLEVPPELLANYLQRLNALPEYPSMAARIDGIERLMFVDVVVSLARGKVDKEMFSLVGGEGAGLGVDLLEKIPGVLFGTIDWDTMLRDGNAWYDRIVAAMEEDSFAEQETALSAVEADIKSLAEGIKSPLRVAAIVLSDNKTRGQLVGKQIGEILVSLLLPATKAASAAEHRGKMLFDLSRVAVALETYRAALGEYPESLAPLTVDVLKQLPTDRFDGKPLRYERRGEGYLLYSVGMNGQDDHATSYISNTENGEHVAEDQIDSNDGDDLVVRVPLSK